MWRKLSKAGGLAALGLMLVLVAASSASATTITILNPSFELQQPPDGIWSVNPSGDGYYTNPPSFIVTDWNYGSSTVAGLLHPHTTTWMNYVPEGGNVARIGPLSYMSQILTATLAANTQYTLTVEVGARKDSYAFGGYQVQLGVDNGGTFVSLQQDNSTLIPTKGNFLKSTVNFDSTGSSYIGKKLEVRLYVPNNVQTLFDDVKLEGTSLIPLPSTLLLLGSGLVGLLALRRRRKSDMS